MANINGYADTLASVAQSYITGGTVTQPSQWWVGLFTSAVLQDCSNLAAAEVTLGVYAYGRVQINASTGADPKWSTPGAAGTNFRVSNQTQVQFAQASGGNWGTIVYAVVIKSSTSQTSADGLFGGPLASSKAIDDGTTAVFLADTLAITTVNAP